MKDLSKRMITAIIGILILLFIIKKGDLLLALGILFLSIVGIREFYQALEKNNNTNCIKNIGYISTIGMFLSNISETVSLNLVINLSMLLLLIYFLMSDRSLEDIALTLLGILYIPFSFTHIYYLNNQNTIWLYFLLPFASDTFAYFAGNFFGKRKLSPKISPNKTVEGSIGGFLGSILVGLIFNYYFELTKNINIIILSIIAAFLGQLGDLIASKIKRSVGIKDYGFIFPGHGGVLDRFDSIILSAPAIYYFVNYFF